MSHAAHRDFSLLPDDAERLANLSGPFDEHLRQIESRLGVEIANRANVFRVTGEAEAVHSTEALLRSLYAETSVEDFDPHKIHLRLNSANLAAVEAREGGDYVPQEIAIRVKRGVVRGRGDNQAKYLHAIATHDINFGVGPAGTGKTYLAVASAVEALNESRVQRLLLVRPAVEAGEKLGFLPGDLAEKVNPYLRPLHDALYDILGYEKVGRMLERNIIEVAPLAFMRGRTLNHSFIILDEAQNTTPEQMKMFLTRIGFNSKAVINGDVTQVDLPQGRMSGLREAQEVLSGVEGIKFFYFDQKDVVRHVLVQKIVTAYEAFEKRRNDREAEQRAARQAAAQSVSSGESNLGGTAGGG
ncbi:MAG: PhoH family protein [Thermoanaerobaculia bacterium]